MGDERQSAPAAEATGPAATPVPTASATASAGRNPDPVRSATAEAEIGGDYGEGHKGEGGDAFGSRTQTKPEDGAGYGSGTEACAEASGSPAAKAEGKMTLDEIEGHVLRAIRYHEARARFLDFWRRVFDFLVVVLGAGAVTSATTDYKVLGTMIGIALAAIGALQLVAGFSEKAGEHTSLKRRFCDVLARITEAKGEPEVTDRMLAKITKRWAAIWADEPPTMHVLEAIAWNAARRTREHDLDENTLIAVGTWHSLTRNLSSWESFEPLTRKELAARKLAKKV